MGSDRPGVGDIFGGSVAWMGFDMPLENSRCKCHMVCTAMNNVGPQHVEDNIERWEVVCKKSARSWFKWYEEEGGWVKKRLEPSAMRLIRPLLLWACQQAKALDDVEHSLESEHQHAT